MLQNLLQNLRDARDVLRRARSPAELAKALVPATWLSRHVLNDRSTGDTPQKGLFIAEELKKLQRALMTAAIDDEGRVRYSALRDSSTHRHLETQSRLLQSVDLGELRTDEQRIAFWTNIYNVLAIHGVLALGIRDSVMEVPSFFGTVAYRVGGLVFTLDEIENGVLRRNAPHPATGTKPFQEGDPRLIACPSRVDPRIHAALVCASTSCPPVAFYDASRLGEQLDLASQNYLASEVRVDEAERRIRVPITFRYYARDFGGPDGVRAFLLEHSLGDQAEALRKAFGRDYAFSYDRYDWSLNAIA